MRYGVSQEQDWNRLDDEAFRLHIRKDFETHYPAELRYVPHRLHWPQLKGWYCRMAAKG